MNHVKIINTMFMNCDYMDMEGNIMGHVIAVAGKGGVGKTTLCGLIIQYPGYKARCEGIFQIRRYRAL